MIYGNNNIKRILLIGLGVQKEFTTDKARSIAAQITCLADGMNLPNLTIDGESFGLRRNIMAQAFSEGLILGSYQFNDYKTKIHSSTWMSPSYLGLFLPGEFKLKLRLAVKGKQTAIFDGIRLFIFELSN